MISWLFAVVQKSLQKSPFSLNAFRKRLWSFAWVAARLLHIACARQTRACDLLIRNHSPSHTGADIEGHRKTKPRCYQESDSLEGHRGTGGDTRLRSKPGTHSGLHCR